MTIASYKDLDAFFQKYGYTFQAWRMGMRAVPRAYVTEIPKRWSKTVDQVSTQTKKEIFYSALLPIVLKANEIIMEDRHRAEPLTMQILSGATVSATDQQYLIDLAKRYQLQLSPNMEHNHAALKELMLRVDLIPPSLALAQAAYESAYATSRFAGLGNALYGQQSSDGSGIDPIKGKYQVATFESPLAATLAYSSNLNTNKAYRHFRIRRSEFRRSGKFPDGAALALTLTAYSERGEAYGREIANIIRELHLTQADLAFLRNMDQIYLVPKKHDYF